MRKMRLFALMMCLTGIPGAVCAQQKKAGLLRIEPLPGPPSPDHVPQKDAGFTIVRKILVSGNRKTKEPIILRNLGIHPGDTLYRGDIRAYLEEKQQQLLNTSLFLTAHVSLTDPSADTTDVAVDVKERWYFFAFPIFSLADRNFNVWWVERHHSLERVNYGLNIYQNNMTGKNDQLSLSLQHGYTRKYALTYQLPYFDRSLKHGAGITVSYSHNHEVNFRTDSNKLDFYKSDFFLKKEVNAGLFYTYKKAIRLRHRINLNYRFQSVQDTILALNPSYFPDGDPSQQYLELSYNFSYTGADSWAYPLKGFNISATLTRRGFGLLGKVNETELQMNTARYLELFPGTYASAGLRGKVILPSGQPYFLLRGMGYYEDYLRGLEYYVADADHYGIFKANLKQEVLAFRVRSDLLPPHFSTVPIRIYAKIYGDLGYAHSRFPGNSLLNNKLLYTYGIGLDMVTFYDLHLRVEYSFNQLGEKGLFLHTKAEL